MLMRYLSQHRGSFGQDGDARARVEVVGIHGAFDDALVLAIGARLLQQPVNQRGFPWSTCAMMAILRMFIMVLKRARAL